MNTYDSTEDTLKHIARVRALINEVQIELDERAHAHDQSKLREPEKSAFDRTTPRLASSTYGSDEYKSFLADLKPALEHHYANNSHHPEHFGYLECDLCFTRHPKGHDDQCTQCRNGSFTLRPDIGGMSLLDLLEMLCDWKAAGERHADGSMARSLEVNRKRFDVSDQLQRILENTAREMGWLTPSERRSRERKSEV